MNETIEMIGIRSSLLGAHCFLDCTLFVQHGGGFTEGLEQFLPHAALRIDVKFLLEIRNARSALADHLSTGGFFLACDQAELRRLSRTVDTNETDSIARFHLPGDITEDLTGWIDLADALESQHRCRAGSSIIPADCSV